VTADPANSTGLGPDYPYIAAIARADLRLFRAHSPTVLDDIPARP
jgi:hypothetical protein